MSGKKIVDNGCACARDISQHTHTFFKLKIDVTTKLISWELFRNNYFSQRKNFFGRSRVNQTYTNAFLLEFYHIV